MANHDILTGLKNRTAGEILINKSYSDFLHNKQEFSIIFCDIDHFKKINDTYGHSSGDRVLQTFSDVIVKTVRQSDSVIRWGGEEFIVLLNNCNLNSAAEIAEKIRKNVESKDDQEIGKITISLGVASIKKNESIEELLNRADSALYESKQNGRNRFTIAL